MSASHERAVRDGPVVLAVLGTPCAFTAAALEGLLAGGLAPALVVLRERYAPAPSPPGMLVERGADQAARVATTHGLALVRVTDVNGETVRERLAALAPDVLLAACLGQRVGAALREVARSACLNIHPSLLPAYRGADPVSAQLAAGERFAGVSVHAMVTAFDAGPVLAQARLAVPQGGRAPALARELAYLGGRLAAALLDAGEPAAGAAQEMIGSAP